MEWPTLRDGTVIVAAVGIGGELNMWTWTKRKVRNGYLFLPTRKKVWDSLLSEECVYE